MKKILYPFYHIWINMKLMSSHRYYMLGLHQDFNDWKQKNEVEKPSIALQLRETLYKKINTEVLSEDTPINYLEFGVFTGRSMKSWKTFNTQSSSRFYGFDTFTGLPEDWGDEPKGTYNAENKLPVIEDERVNFIKGFFQDTLPPFLKEFNSDKQLVINVDADLYSATLFVLCSLDKIIFKDTIIIFDEFNCLRHEFKAFLDYLEAYKRDYKVIYTSDNTKVVAITITK